MRVEVEAQWREFGAVKLDLDGRLSFPIVPDLPGVYRLRLADRTASSYVGEASRLRRRLGNYRLGPTGQRTSRRVHLRLLDHLANGGTVSLALVTEATLRVDGAPRVIDLRLKRARLLVENAALHALPEAEPIENRPGVGEAS